MKLGDLSGIITDLLQNHPEYRHWDVVSIDTLFQEMYIAGPKAGVGKYVRLGQQLGPESPRADSTY